MSQLRMMKPGKGDVKLAEWDVKDEQSVALSKDEFDKMMGTGGKLAYATDPKGQNVAIQTFAPDAETITIVPLGIGG